MRQLWEPACDTLKNIISELPEDAQLAVLPLLLESA